MALLQAAPEVHCRKETVEVPELGGDVVVRGLTASELFAVEVFRQQALQRVVRQRAAAPKDDDEPAELAALTFGELCTYGAHVPAMLARTVTIAHGLALFSEEQWESAEQQWPGISARLAAVVERLSGMNKEDAQKN